MKSNSLNEKAAILARTSKQFIINEFSPPDNNEESSLSLAAVLYFSFHNNIEDFKATIESNFFLVNSSSLNNLKFSTNKIYLNLQSLHIERDL